MLNELTDALVASSVAAWRYDVESQAVLWLVPPVFLGLPEEALAIATFAELVHPADRRLLRKAIRHAVRTGDPLRARFRLETPDHTRWIELAGRTDGGGRVVTGVLVDVTTEMEAEEALLAAAHDAEVLLGLGHSASWQWRVDGDDVVVRACGDHDETLDLTLPGAASAVARDHGDSPDGSFRAVSRDSVFRLVTRVRARDDARRASVESEDARDGRDL